MTRVRLVDDPSESGRTTVTLVASLASRLATLHVVSGAAAVGSLVSGFAALGRHVSRTAEGAMLRRAVASGRVGHNGDAIWSALGIGPWASDLPSAPVLDHLRNDLAVVLAHDLGVTLKMLPIPSEPGRTSADGEDAPASFADCLVGLWAYSREMVRAVEALAAEGGRHAAPLAEPPATAPDGSLLR